MKAPRPEFNLDVETRSQDSEAPATQKVFSSAASLRLSRLSRGVQWALAILVLLSLVSGGAVWWGQEILEEDLRTPAWLQPALVVHGVLNPFLSVLFGFLWFQHMRIGWQKKDHRMGGASLAICFGLLILSGTGLYYGGASHGIFSVTHRLMGVLLPFILALHWVQAVRANRN